MHTRVPSTYPPRASIIPTHMGTPHGGGAGDAGASRNGGIGQKHSRLDLLASCAVDDRTIPQQIADLFIDRADRGGCTEDDLLDEGFTQAEIATHGEAAKAIARAQFTRRIERPVRTASQGADIILAYMSNEVELHFQLRQRGWTSDEIATHWLEMRALAAARLHKAMQA